MATYESRLMSLKEGHDRVKVFNLMEMSLMSLKSLAMNYVICGELASEAEERLQWASYQNEQGLLESIAVYRYGKAAFEKALEIETNGRSLTEII